MKVALAIFILFYGFCINAQTISTVAGGNGVSGYNGDGGPVTAAGIGHAGYINFDVFGNYYFEELNNTIRKVSPLGIISTVAGNGMAGFSGDFGPATDAQFNFTGGGGAACDISGNLYIADQANNRIRKVDAMTGIVTTIAGTGAAGFMGDGGPASNANLNSPESVTFDSNGNLFIVDGFNYRIRKIDVVGNISTIAGTGIMGFSGDGGPATAAKIYVGGRVFAHKGNLFQSDGYRIRKISLTSGIISSVAGTGIQGFSGDGGPATASQLFFAMDVTIDAFDNIYISDMDNNRIRIINPVGIINTFAGDGSGAYGGDGGPATAAKIYSPRGIALDSCGNLLVVDNGNGRIRKVAYLRCDYLNVEREKSPNLGVNIYPNPVFDLLNVDNLKIKSTYSIYNIVGTQIQQGTLKQGNNTISIKSLPPGMYLLQLINEEGERTVTKIIKQ